MVNDQTGEEIVEIPLQRVASHELDEEGLINCQKDCTCNDRFRNNWVVSLTNNFLYISNSDHVLFDNSYSYFKAKQISYSVALVKQQNVSDLEAAADNISTN